MLLAENHPLNQELACELLRRAGIEVVVARDGSEALDKLANEGPFDGVLMDCQMPMMDGYTATGELRSRPEWQQLPVIAMPARALAEDRDRALASGMNAHITKPIHIESMLRTMAQWISGPGTGTSDQGDLSGTPTAEGETAAIHAAAGLSLCMGNQALYRRLLDGFRRSEAGFVDDVRSAVREQRWGDALRRAHDIKGLAGTIGALPLRLATQAVHAALGEHRGNAATGTAEIELRLEGVRIELAHVLCEIDAIAARS